MKTWFMAAFVVILGMGCANAQELQSSAPAGQAQFDYDADGGCEQTGSNIWSCWACDENEGEAATMCDFFTETDDGEEVPLTTKRDIRLRPYR